MNQIMIENVEFEKDIGVIFDNELEFDRHIKERRRRFITKSTNNYITVHYLQKAETQT